MSSLTSMQALLVFLVTFLGPALILKIPVAFAMGISSIIVLFLAGVPLISVAQVSYANLDNFTLLAVLFFIVAGTFMEYSGISNMLIRWVESFVGRFRGNMGAICILTSMAFGTLTGSAISTLSAIGKMMLPEMNKKGYSKSYAAALASVSCFLGIMIPPSAPGIIFALASGVSLLKVWMSTIGPGILLGAGYIIVNYFKRKNVEEKVQERFIVSSYVKNVGVKTKSAFFALLMPVIIFGGIYGGVFTPTEAGAVSLVYGLAYYLGKKITNKTNTEKGLWFISVESAVLTGKIALLLVFAAAVGRMVAYTQISNAIADFVIANVNSRFTFLLIVNIILLILGCFMELNANLVLMTPLLLPSAIAVGVDPIHFGAIMLVNLSIGLATPPFGMSLFVASKMADAPFEEVVKESLPYIGVGIVVIFITTYCPSFVMFFANLF